MEDQTNQIKAKIENVSQELKSYNENKQELIDHMASTIHDMTEKLKSLKIEKENHEKVKVKFLVAEGDRLPEGLPKTGGSGSARILMHVKLYL